MNHLNRSKRFFVTAAVTAVFFVLPVTYSSSFAQQTVKPTADSTNSVPESNEKNNMNATSFK